MNRFQKWMYRGVGRILERREERGHLVLLIASALMRYAPGQITCREFERFILDYCEGRLTPRQVQIFQTHLEVCPMCRAYFESYVRIIEILGPALFDETESPVPRDMPDELVDAILATADVR